MLDNIFDSLEQAKKERSQDGKYKENLLGTEWFGIVVSVDNTKYFDGRCKIRIFEKFDDITDEDLPWAFPKQSNIFGGGSGFGCGSFSYPKIGTIVRITFNNGDIYHPEYTFIQNLNNKMIDEIKQSFINCHVLLYDEDSNIKIMYTDGV